MSALLSAEDIVGGYASAEQVVKGVTLTADAGELVTVIGPNGAGKSTALKLVAGLLRPSRGQVRIGGEDVAGRSPQSIARAGLGFVPQERNIFGSLTIAENLEMGCLFERRATRQRMEEAFARFPMLAEKRRAAARSLSGGQRQVLAVAMALMGRPRALLLDEPTAGLSPRAASELFALVRTIATGGIAVLMVEQNALESLSVSDRAYVLVDGRNHLEGPARAVADDPDIRRLFLGGRAHHPAGE
ncbi:ABC transporter ATP-binding protein [Pseudoroseomonas ludipueritiae]|uniref:ABC transporter ATP-binding protein n=1 Tax=Pseudoroseomonas ludipueritiae TaxID=198093 RepID=A0ABR7R592_9PROT|nr:ABC transporter ATP-binding protein [Pseudoroseomonas ludipueritiae]MBC9176930.1 ABC transporter ATP-binding protein [Pseudoroseomonas ludipueritiae]MCG7361532.1 ABC transporter ATP-binding protein [Roseomonas sp. ACRSG]